MSCYRTQYSPQVGLGGRITPGVKALIIANVSVFVLQILVGQFGGRTDMEQIFGLTPGRVIHDRYLWQLVTYMFLHSTGWLSHLLLNMLMLWMFGTEVERVWGTREFVKYYFLCGIGAAVTTCLIFPGGAPNGAHRGTFCVIRALRLSVLDRPQL